MKNYWNSHLKKKLMKMGIDPNNHKLNHIPYHITNPKLSTTVASSTQKTQATGRSDGDNEVTSDGRCCFDYDKSCGVPDLNLNLSLFTMVTLKNEEGENHNCNSKVVHSPNTLLLFEWRSVVSLFSVIENDGRQSVIIFKRMVSNRIFDSNIPQNKKNTKIFSIFF